MANENLGAKFSIDITDLKAGLAQANRLIRESESEFLEAAAGMDNWEESAEGLTKRVKTLSKQVDIQQEKVNALVDEKKRLVKQMKEEGKSNEEIEKAVDNVNKSIQREGKQLDTLKKKLQQSEKNLEKFEDATDNVADALEDVADESEDAQDATDKLTKEITEQKTQLDQLKRAYSNYVLEQGDSSDAAKALKNQIKGLSDELKTNEKRLADATDGLEDLNDEAKNAGDGFTIAKGAIAGMVSGGLMSLASAAGNAFSQMMDLSESTRELRTNMAKLETAYESAGLSADDASETFKNLYAVLGDEGKATEAASFLAKYADDEKELAEQTRILTGVFAEYGDSIPTESLAEGISATIAMGEVQSGLSDALEWQGVNLDEFNEKLAECTTEKEREALITETLNKLYGESADAFMENNKSVIEAQEATAEYNEKMAVLGAKMEPLNTAFTKLKSTLADAVTPAVGWLADKTAGLVTQLTNAKDETDLLNESQRATVEAAQNAADEYEETTKSARKLASAGMSNVNYATRLIGKLEDLVDENGNVQESDKTRVEYILGELNDALGTEYDSIYDVVDANGAVKDSVYDVIEAKKAQILMEAYEESYRQAILNVADAEEARAIQAGELAAQELVVLEKRQEAHAKAADFEEATKDERLNWNQAILNGYMRERDAAEIAAQEEERILGEKQAAYRETDSTVNGYYANIAAYEEASILLMEGKTAEAISLLEDLAGGYEDTTGSVQKSTEDRMKILEQEVIDTEVHAQLMRAAYEAGVEGVTEDMVKTAEDAAETAKEQFKEIGGNITEGIGEGAEGKKWTLSTKMSSLISGAVNAAKKAAGIESPSTLFRDEVGQWIPQGVAEGIDDETDAVVDSIDSQINAARKAYDVGKINDAISGNVNVHGGGKKGSDELASGSKGNVIVNQTNHYSQAHSRYEIFKSKEDTAAAVRLALMGG